VNVSRVTPFCVLVPLLISSLSSSARNSFNAFFALVAVSNPFLIAQSFPIGLPLGNLFLKKKFTCFFVFIDVCYFSHLSSSSK